VGEQRESRGQGGSLSLSHSLSLAPSCQILVSHLARRRRRGGGEGGHRAFFVILLLFLERERKRVRSLRGTETLPLFFPLIASSLSSVSALSTHTLSLSPSLVRPFPKARDSRVRSFLLQYAAGAFPRTANALESRATDEFGNSFCFFLQQLNSRVARERKKTKRSHSPAFFSTDAPSEPTRDDSRPCSCSSPRGTGSKGTRTGPARRRALHLNLNCNLPAPWPLSLPSCIPQQPVLFLFPAASPTSSTLIHSRDNAPLKRHETTDKKSKPAMPPSWPRRQQHRPSSAAANAAVIDDDPDHAGALHLTSDNAKSASAAAVLSAASRKSASPAVSSGRKTSRLVAACFGKRGGAEEERDFDLSPAGKAEAAAAAAEAEDEDDDFRINRRSLTDASGFINQQQPSSFPSPPTPLVLLTTVDVGGGRVESVTVSDGDDVEAAAEAFCAEHRLPEAVAAPLAAHLAENLLAARRARAASRRRTTMEAAAATAAWAAHGGEEGIGAAGGPNPILLPPPPRALLAAAATAEESAALQGKRFDFDFDEEEEEEEAAVAAADSPPLPLAAEVGIVTAAVRNEHAAPSAAAAAAAAATSAGGGTAARRGAAAAARRAANASSSSQQQQHPPKMTWVSAQLASGRSKGPYESYAHRLYAEGLEGIRARAAAAETAAARKEEAELDGATWMPSISRLRNKSSSSDPSAPAGASAPRRGGNAWERLSATPLRTAAERDRLERLRDERLEAEAAECTFAPAVSRGTKKIIAARDEARGTGSGDPSCSSAAKDRASSLYESLYRDAERRRVRAAQEEEAFYAARGAPTAERAPAAAPAGDGKGRSENPPAVALRLLARRARVDARLAAERDAAERRPVDARTGRPLFAPCVGRPPSDVPSSSLSSNPSADLSASRRSGQQRLRPSDTSVGDFLFQQQRAIDARRAAAVARADAALAAASSARAIPRSQEMMARLRGRRFRQVHRYLGNGLLGASSSGSAAAATPGQGGGGGEAAAAAPVPLDALPPLDLAAAAADAALLSSMDPEVAADVAAAARLAEAAGVVAAPGASSPPALLDAAAFAALMEAVVRRSGVPRAYLQPRGAARRGSSSSGGVGRAGGACCAGSAAGSLPSRHHARCGGHEAETFAPAILPESVALAEAAGRRPAGVDVVRAMAADAAAASAQLELSRERVERQELAECTFRPRLVAQERPVRGARDPGADAAAAARARTQVGREMPLPHAAGGAARARRFEEEEAEVGGGGDGAGGVSRIPSLPFLQQQQRHVQPRPRSPGVGEYEQLDYELRAAIEEAEEAEREEEEGEGKRPAAEATSKSGGRNVFEISASASATGVFLASSSSATFPAAATFKPPSLPESTIEALRALAFEASERREGGGGGEEEREIEQLEQQMPSRPKSRGGGWQMAI